MRAAVNTHNLSTRNYCVYGYMDVVLAPFLTTTTAIRGQHLLYLALKCTVTNCLSALPINQCHKLFICFANQPMSQIVYLLCQSSLPIACGSGIYLKNLSMWAQKVIRDCSLLLTVQICAIPLNSPSVF